MALRSLVVASLLLAFSVPASNAAGGAINPRVRVLPSATTAAPPECAEGTAPNVPVRPPLREAEPAISSPEPPPRIDLQTALRRTQAAAERGARAEFHERLASLERVVSEYPRGGEAGAAAGVIDVYRDLERLWAYTFSAPAGAFFGASSEGGALLRMLQKYPEWPRGIGAQTIRDQSGTTFYPTSESRQYLVAEAGRRLSRLGVGSSRAAETLRTDVQPTSPLVFGDRSTPVTIENRPPREARNTTVPTDRDTPRLPRHNTIPEPSRHSPDHGFSERPGRETTTANKSTQSSSATHQSTNQATHQSSNRSTHPSTNQATHQSTRQATRPSTDQATHHATHDSTSNATNSATHQAPSATTSASPSRNASHAVPTATPVTQQTQSGRSTPLPTAVRPVPSKPVQIAQATRPSPPTPARTAPPATTTHAPAPPVVAPTRTPLPVPAPATNATAASSSTEPVGSTGSGAASGATNTSTAPTAVTSGEDATATSTSQAIDTSGSVATSTATTSSEEPAEPAPSPGADRTRIIIAALMIAIGLVIAVALIRASK